MPETRGKTSELVSRSVAERFGAIRLPNPPVTTDRCRATHDIPYTLRCTLWRGHDLNGQPHEDKEGREW